jgi:GNAT superfamily N-acetyltransferase
MSFALRHRNDVVPALAPLPGLVVRQEPDAGVMAAAQGRTVAEMAARMDAAHRAYVALLDGEITAWGWVATRSATIGELGATFAIPAGDRYLWNFVTRPTHRGLGIYPRLLDSIVASESREAERFWIAYAPENRASATGIARSGFTTVAELSFDATGAPAMRALARGAAMAGRVVGLPVVDAPLAPCWRCVRAGKVMACREGECRCDYQKPDVGCAA